jgi:hypothetical protein
LNPVLRAVVVAIPVGLESAAHSAVCLVRA